MAVGPWGDGGDVVVALAPILLVVGLTLKKDPPPPTTSLPLAALLAWFCRLAYFGSDPNYVNAAALAEALGALSVISIIYGARHAPPSHRARLTLRQSCPAPRQ